MKVSVAEGLGYCSGVEKAIEMAMEYGDKHRQVYSLGTIAHNEAVVQTLLAHGVQPIPSEAILPGTHIAITAHGAPPSIYGKARNLGCEILDCTCPIVRKAQTIVSTILDEYDIIIYGDPDHQEIQALKGWALGEVKYVGTGGDGRAPVYLGKKVAVVSQTTQVPSKYMAFIHDLLEHGLPQTDEIRLFDTICPIVTKRIKDAHNLACNVDILFVVGSQKSANTANLARVCEEVLHKVYTIQGPDQVAVPIWRRQGRGAGVTAGTSTPIEMVEAVVQKLREV